MKLADKRHGKLSMLETSLAVLSLMSKRDSYGASSELEPSQNASWSMLPTVLGTYSTVKLLQPKNALLHIAGTLPLKLMLDSELQPLNMLSLTDSAAILLSTDAVYSLVQPSNMLVPYYATLENVPAFSMFLQSANTLFPYVLSLESLVLGMNGDMRPDLQNALSPI